MEKLQIAIYVCLLLTLSLLLGSLTGGDWTDSAAKWVPYISLTITFVVLFSILGMISKDKISIFFKVIASLAMAGFFAISVIYTNETNQDITIKARVMQYLSFGFLCIGISLTLWTMKKENFKATFTSSYEKGEVRKKNKPPRNRRR